MSGFNEDRERQVVPRWRAFTDSARMGEITPHITSERSVSTQDIDVLSKEWQRERSVSVASDLVSAALTLSSTYAFEAAQFLLASPNATPAARGVASVYLNDLFPGLSPAPPSPQKSGTQDCDDLEGINNRLRMAISLTRKNLADYPRNPILWCDLSRLYTSVGLQVQASRAMSIAISLGKTNRFILRAASRLSLHQGDPEKAQSILLSSPNIATDPWLMAAEIATSATMKKSSHMINHAVRALSLDRFPPFHSSELASAIGTLEIQSGKLKPGQKLITSSLRQPTENSVAQAAWLYRDIGPKVPPVASSVKSPEAAAWSAWRHGSWETSLSEIKSWRADEPFASRPVILATHIASVVLEDHQMAADLARETIASNPDDVTLYNNLAFSLAHLGRISEATAALAKASHLSLDHTNRIALPATMGLVAFRSGLPTQGKTLYEQAIREAHNQGDRERETVARIYLALEANRSHLPDADLIKRRALEASKSLVSLSYRSLANRLAQT